VNRFDRVELIKSVEDYEAYNDRFPTILPSRSLHLARHMASRRYRVSCALLIFWRTKIFKFCVSLRE